VAGDNAEQIDPRLRIAGVAETLFVAIPELDGRRGIGGDNRRSQEE
jgi:hypothetical protein